MPKRRRGFRKGMKTNAGNPLTRRPALSTGTGALDWQGSEFGDNAAALLAIVRYRRLAELRPRNAFPLDWAQAQFALGNVLQTLGERESGTARLEQSIAATREALKEWTRERVPLQWATAQNNLGYSLVTLGERERGTARLNEAVTSLAGIDS
jgi:tetratricopeptide (TPR) repeat protein